jgi:carboxypeptidase T
VNDQRKRIFPLTLIIVLLTSSMWAVGAPSAAQDPELSDPAVVRIYVDGQEHLNAIAGEVDIWEVHLEKGFAVAAVGPAEYQWLQSLGYRMEIDAERTALLGIRAPLDPRFHYFDDYYTNPNGLYVVDSLQGVNADHPELTELIDIGNAWLTDHGGHPRDMWVLRVSNEDPAYGPIGNKPAFFLFANIHAREVATPELAIRYIKYLTDGYLGEGGYGLDPDVTWLVNHNVVYVLVMQNPDGHVENEQNTSANRRKNMDNDDGCNDPGSWGVDLNRNHSFFWGCCGGSSGDPCNTLYRGPDRASEPETWAFQNYFANVMLDQNGPNGNDQLPPAAPDDATGIFISLHQSGDVILWPYGFDPGGAPNDAQLQTIGRKFAYYNGYDPNGFIYTVDGSSDDWTYGKFGIASFTYEIGSGGSCGGFFPDYECIDGEPGWPRSFWAENGPAFLYAHKIARTPYMTSYGPDAENVAVVPGAAAPGSVVDVTATIADHRYGGDPLQPIVAAEYFVDAPGDDGTGTPLAASDGGWGGLSEDVEAVLDTTGLATGQHYVLVHGQNDDGDWGPFTAAFLYIVDPAISPTLEGYVRDANTSAPLEATVTANTFQTGSDPATGYYSMTVISDTYTVSAVAASHLISTVTGLEAHDYQTVQQDFYLQPICEAFADDVESGNLGWTTQGSWAITAEASHSPSHSWTDSPGGDYGNNWNYSLTSPILDLTDHEGVTLSFWHIYDLENGYDYGYVEVSIDGGGTWTTAGSHNGEGQLTWSQEELMLPALDGQANARIRFRLDTDYSVVADGWHIDDVVLYGGGPACAAPLAPAAEFASNSPVTLGNPVVLTNLTTGTTPIDYWWDFGDGVGTSTESDPEYTYLATGTYTVTLVATNTVGSDSVDHPVVVLPGECVDLSEIAITGDTVGEPGTYTFTTSYEPPYATLPITYTWDNGDDTGTSVRTLDVGTHMLAVTATNCADALVTDTLTIVISEPVVCTDVTGVDLTLVTTGTIYTSTLVELSADVAPDDAGKPYTFTVDYGDGMAPVMGNSSDDPLALTYTYDTTGTYEIGIAVWNCEMAPEEAVTDTLTLTVREAGVCVDLSGLTILGETAGLSGTYTFTTSFEPPDASLPISYTWDNGDISAVSVRALDVGTYTLVVTATNCVDALVTDTHTIVIGEPGFYVYLPLVVKGHVP